MHCDSKEYLFSLVEQHTSIVRNHHMHKTGVRKRAACLNSQNYDKLLEGLNNHTIHKATPSLAALHPRLVQLFMIPCFPCFTPAGPIICLERETVEHDP